MALTGPALLGQGLAEANYLRVRVFHSPTPMPKMTTAGRTVPAKNSVSIPHLLLGPLY